MSTEKKVSLICVAKFLNKPGSKIDLIPFLSLYVNFTL